MALTPVKKILQMADKANTSVIAFNCTDYNMIYSVVQAAQKVQKPVIAMLYPEHMTLNNTINIESFGECVRSLAAEVEVPIGLHLDHCTDFGLLVRALRAGYSSVMYDGSMLELEQNIANTKKIADVAHCFDAIVEAELGHVGVAATVSDQSNEDMYTQANVAADFCKRSGCDALAVAIGSAHGVYKQTPHLDLNRLAEINAATEIPLVLHGGSGIPDDQLEIAFTRGINKFNVGTEFFMLYNECMQDYTATKGNIFDFYKYAQERLIQYLVKKMELTKM